MAAAPPSDPSHPAAVPSHGGSPSSATLRRAARVLIADDETAICTALERYLTKRGYDVRVVHSGTDALAALGVESVAVLLCDVRMPGLSGPDVVPRALAVDPDLAIIMLSGLNDAPTAAEVMAHGAMDYLTKPVDLSDVGLAVERALARREQAMAERRTERMIRAEVALRTEELERRTADLERERATLRKLTVSIAETLINAMETKDVYLRGHSHRVAELAASIADRLGLDADAVEHVRLAGRLHDVGYIGIRESVLNKPDKLTVEEFGHVKDHVWLGMEILAPLSHLGPALEYIHDHHERWDGGGYPRARRGEEITLGGRILAAADSFDALTSRRAYRHPMTPREALEHLAPTSDAQFGPGVFAALREIIERGAALVFVDDLR